MPPTWSNSSVSESELFSFPTVEMSQLFRRNMKGFTYPGSGPANPPPQSKVPYAAPSKTHQKPSGSSSHVVATPSSDHTKPPQTGYARPSTFRTTSVKVPPTKSSALRIPTVTRPGFSQTGERERPHEVHSTTPHGFPVLAPEVTESFVLVSSQPALITSPGPSLSLAATSTTTIVVFITDTNLPSATHPTHALPTTGMPLTPQQQQEAQTGNSMIAIAVSSTLGAIVVAVLAVYFCMHWRKRKALRASGDEESTQGTEKQSPGPWSREGSVRTRLPMSHNGSVMTIDTTDRRDFAAAVNWADREPAPVQAQTQAPQNFSRMPPPAQTNKPLPDLPAPNTPIRGRDTEGVAVTSDQTVHHPRSRSVSPLSHYDPSAPHATQHEYAKVSPPQSPKLTHTRLDVPGQCHWGGARRGQVPDSIRPT